MSTTDVFTHRLANEQDLEPLLGLMRAFYDEEHLTFDAAHTRDTAIRLLSARSLGLVLLIETSQKPVGYVAITFGFSLEFHGRFALLDEFYLAPSVRGRGWGRRCLALVAETAREHEARCVRLEVNRANRRARELYLKDGFTDDQRDIFSRWL